MTPFCAHDIAQFEGCRLHAYRDTLGIWTIGFGHTPSHEGEVWTKDHADAVFAEDVNAAAAGVGSVFPWFTKLSDPRQDVLVNMAFQLGLNGLREFRQTLADIEAGRYSAAAGEMLHSRWATQTPSRAQKLSAQMASGSRSL